MNDAIQSDTATLSQRLQESSAIPADCTDEELSAADLSHRDVLIGTVRSDAQLDYTLASLSYYAPVKTVPPQELPVRIIALHEEGLTRLPGIKRYGEVTEIRVVRRDEIPLPLSRPNGEEAYYLFTVRSWVLLEQPIAIAGTSRGRPAFTSEFLLTHARRSYQLVSITSPAVYRLAQVLCRAREEAAIKEGRAVLLRVGESHVIGVSEGMLSLIHARGDRLYRCPLRAMDTEPGEVLRDIAQRLGLDDRTGGRS